MSEELLLFLLGGIGTAGISSAISLYTILAKSPDARETWPASFRALFAALVGFELGAHFMFACAADFCLVPPVLLLSFFLLPPFLMISLALLLISIHKETARAKWKSMAL